MRKTVILIRKIKPRQPTVLDLGSNQTANVTFHTNKNVDLSADFHRMAARRCTKKALVLLEHSILINT